MRQASLCLLLCLAAVGQGTPVKQDYEEDLNQLMKRFMFDNYDYDYTIDNHHEDESPEEHQRHATTTRRPSRKQQRKTQAQKQKELREKQRSEQEQKKRELEEQQAREQEQKEEKELKEAKEGGETQQQEEAVDGNGNSSAVDPQLREFTLIISKLLFHLSQL